MEIIFVDDGSTDKTLELVRSFGLRTEVTTRVFHQDWRGIAAARNVVVRESRAQYIVWVDGDMRLPRDHVSKQVEFMNLNPNVGAAKAGYGLSQSKKTVALLENARAFDLHTNDSKLVGTGGSIYRVEAIRQVGGFDESIRGAGEDIDALARMKERGWALSSTKAKFYERYKENWRDLWRQYYWWGYGAYHVQKSHRKPIFTFTRLPLVAFFLGILRFGKAYKADPRKMYFLLPFHSVFKDTAWLAGYINAHTNRHAH
jgi:glycosyltransferase involved in cell wall biosynthesis